MPDMEISPDARAIVDALIDEGYAWLAGELLEDLATGVRPDLTAGDAEFDVASDDHPIFGKEPLTSKPGGVPRRLEVAQDRPVEPIPPEKQARFATAYLRVRLVEPFRRLKESERIADRLVALHTYRPEGRKPGFNGQRPTGPPVRFALVEPGPVDGRLDGDGASAVEELASALDVVDEAAARTEQER